MSCVFLFSAFTIGIDPSCSHNSLLVRKENGKLLDLLCVGDIAVDIYSASVYPGGCSLNVARHLSRLAGSQPQNIGLMGPVGQDQDRAIVEEAIAGTQIHGHFLTTEHPTIRCYVHVDEKGERSFPRYEAAAMETYRFDHSLQPTFGQYRHLLTLAYKEGEGMFRSLMNLGLPHHIYCDFSDLEDFNASADIVREFVEDLDLVFCGLDANQTALIQDLQALSKEFQTTVIVTLGRGGSLALVQGEKLTQPAQTVSSVLDTTGAGDSFLAAFLYQFLLNEGDIQLCMNIANAYAAQTIQYEGAFRP